MNLVRLLDNITALAGVQGVWLFDSDGLAHVHRSPEGADPAAFEAARTHIAALYASTDALREGVDDYLLRFDGGWLLLRRSSVATVVVQGTQEASPSAVRMVTNVLVRNIDAAALSALRGEAAVPVEPSATDEENLSLAPKRPVRMYRGQPY
jgi:hypothetical protein